MCILLLFVIWFSLNNSGNGLEASSCEFRDLRDVRFIFAITGNCELVFSSHKDEFPTVLGDQLQERNGKNCDPLSENGRPIVFLDACQEFLHILLFKETGPALIREPIKKLRSGMLRGALRVNLRDIKGTDLGITFEQKLDTCAADCMGHISCFGVNGTRPMRAVEYKLIQEANAWKIASRTEHDLPPPIADHVPIGSFMQDTGATFLLLPHVLRWIWQRRLNDKSSEYRVITVPTEVTTGASDMFPQILFSDGRSVTTAACQRGYCEYSVTDVDGFQKPICFAKSDGLLVFGVAMIPLSEDRGKRERSNGEPFSSGTGDSSSSGASQTFGNRTLFVAGGNVNVNTNVHVESGQKITKTGNSSASPAGSLWLSSPGFWLLPILIIFALILFCLLLVCCHSAKWRFERNSAKETTQKVVVPAPVCQGHKCEFSKQDVESLINAIKMSSNNNTNTKVIREREREPSPHTQIVYQPVPYPYAQYPQQPTAPPAPKGADAYYHSGGPAQRPVESAPPTTSHISNETPAGKVMASAVKPNNRPGIDVTPPRSQQRKTDKTQFDDVVSEKKDPPMKNAEKKKKLSLRLKLKESRHDGGSTRHKRPPKTASVDQSTDYRSMPSAGPSSSGDAVPTLGKVRLVSHEEAFGKVESKTNNNSERLSDYYPVSKDQYVRSYRAAKSPLKVASKTGSNDGRDQNSPFVTKEMLRNEGFRIRSTTRGKPASEKRKKKFVLESG